MFRKTLLSISLLLRSALVLFVFLFLLLFSISFFLRLSIIVRVFFFLRIFINRVIFDRIHFSFFVINVNSVVYTFFARFVHVTFLRIIIDFVFTFSRYVDRVSFSVSVFVNRVVFNYIRRVFL